MTMTETVKTYFLQYIAPALGTMLVCILGAFFVYKGYYDGDSIVVTDIAAIEPASGSEGPRSLFQPIDIRALPVNWHYEEASR